VHPINGYQTSEEAKCRDILSVEKSVRRCFRQERRFREGRINAERPEEDQGEKCGPTRSGHKADVYICTWFTIVQREKLASYPNKAGKVKRVASGG
jgi:hypothetical protein